MTDPERYHRLIELFNSACELPAQDRDAFVATACGGDVALRDELAALLAQDRRGASVVDRAAGGGAARLVADDVAGSSAFGALGSVPWAFAPDRIGCYRVVRVIGEGGMGTVYEAEQDHPRRSVALKIVKPGVASATLLRRFELEAHVLGQLRHPGIAQIYEAGFADVEQPLGQGRSSGAPGTAQIPIFAMELIRGRAISAYAKQADLGPRQRLELFAKVCDAVHHAHQRGVIHRDLKPANILVDEFGQPKVLDFGVARVTASDMNAAGCATLQTDAGQLIGTLAYMSPEQLAARSDELDTRSDVFALGVVLYELLAERLPYDIRGRAIPDALRIMSEQDAPRLGAVQPRFRGDVETIVAAALEKDKARRYASAAELAGDIRRYLHNEPIIARPASAAYHLRKFARRHRPIVAGVGATLVALLAGLVATGWFAFKRERERVAAVAARDQARDEADKASEIQRFLQDILTSARPAVAKGRDTTILRDMLARAGERVDAELASRPEVAAAVRYSLGFTYFRLGEPAEAERQLRQAYDGQLRLLGEDHEATFLTAGALGLALNEQGRLTEAEPLLQRSFEYAERTYADEHANVFITLGNLASVYRGLGRRTEAVSLYRRAIAAHRQRGAPDAELWQLMSNLAAVLLDTGEIAEAEALCRDALEGYRRAAGDDDPQVLSAMNQLGVALLRQKQCAQAETILQEAVATGTRVLGPEHPHVLGFLNNLASALRGQAKLDQAEAVYRRMIPVAERVLDPDHPNLLTLRSNLGEMLVGLERPAEAEPFLRDAVRSAAAVRRDNQARYRRNYGRCLADLKRYAEAEGQLLSSFEAFNESLGPEHKETLRAIELLVELYEEWQQPESAVAWRAKLAAYLGSRSEGASDASPISGADGAGSLMR